MLHLFLEHDSYIRVVDIKSFKTKLVFTSKPHPKKTFGIRDRIGLKHLTQLRVGQNPLQNYELKTQFQ